MSEIKSESITKEEPLHTPGVGRPLVGNLPPECSGLVRDLEAARLKIEGLEKQLSFLNPENPRYAPKLAAAVRAWQAVTDPKGKTAKQALATWLREHAAEFGILGSDGKPIREAVAECSKVANWQTSGGAPKTPGG